MTPSCYLQYLLIRHNIENRRFQHFEPSAKWQTCWEKWRLLDLDTWTLPKHGGRMVTSRPCCWHAIVGVSDLSSVMYRLLLWLFIRHLWFVNTNFFILNITCVDKHKCVVGIANPGGFIYIQFTKVVVNRQNNNMVA